MNRLLRSRYARLLTIVLIVQAALFYTASHGDAVPLQRPLDAFPTDLGPWKMAQAGVVDDDTKAVLKANDLMSRWYQSGPQNGVNLFIAYFETQRTGQSPHSPKNCLPGSGWSPTATGFIDIPIPATGESIRINRYIVSKGDQKSVVLYWYQSQRRVVADEFAAKFYLVADSIRYHRSDTALVRIVAPVNGNDESRAQQDAISFVQVAYPVVRGWLPK